MTATHRATDSGSPRAIHRRKHKLRIPLAITAAVVASATGFALLAGASTTPAAASAGSGALQHDFAAAAAEFHVPQGVLLALSYQQTRWESHHGEPSTTGNYNVMGLTQVDPAAVTKALANGPGPETDGRGDDAPILAKPAPVAVKDSPALHTLDAAAKLIKRPAGDLRTDPAQSIRGGAALLAQYQKDAGQAAATDPAAWRDALVRFSQATEAGAGTAFADRVLTTVHDGAIRLTTDGQSVTLAAVPSVVVKKPTALARTATQRSVAQGTADCPAGLACDVRPAAYSLTNPSDPTSYGNYTQANRPADGDQIQYIVIHDTEGGFEGSISAFQNPSNQASAHYIVRSSDGFVSQLVDNQNIAWHAGNKTVNMHSIGVEHEGFAFPTGSQPWYSEQLYQSSAALVSHLAAEFNVPLDRQHIIGHDNVPGPTQAYINGMHWDPGTFWDWNHYMDLLGAPIKANTGGSLLVGGKVTISPAFDSSNQPPVDNSPARPQNFVYLRTGPSDSSPLINNGTTQAADVRDKAVAGSSYVVADQQGDWTSIWYGGQQAWFYNPNGQSGSADNRTGQTVVRPKAGLASIPVYGRTYPELSAYAPYPGINSGSLTPVAYTATIAAGQSYVAGSDTPLASDFYYAQNINGDAPNDRTRVVGTDTYYPISFNHRLAYLKSTDVDVTTATTPAPSGYTPFGPKRILDTRHGIGAPTAQVGQNSTLTLQVTGDTTGVPTDVTAVILNVTAVLPTSGSFVTVYPDGQPRPLASNLNFTAKQIIPNLVVVPVVNGKVDLYNKSGSVDLLADITGYYSPAGTSKFTSLTPTRLLDTRHAIGAPQAPVGPDSMIALKIAGNGKVSVPADATGVVLNVTATDTTSDSYVTVYPDGVPKEQRPTVSNLNFTAGETIPNLVIVPITNGSIDLYNRSGSVDLIADITGYYSSAGTSQFHSAGPTRLLDTRYGLGAPQASLGGGSTLSLTVAGKAGLPKSGVTAVVLNVTAVGATSGSYVTVYPDGIAPVPTVSNLNFSAGETIPNLVIVPVTNGKVGFFNKLGNVNLIADITGYYTAG